MRRPASRTTARGGWRWPACVTRNICQVADIRTCDRCGAAFTPRREHARFCSARCRVAWNRANSYDPAAEASALRWSVTAMSETIARLLRLGECDRPRALGLIGEAVWLVTIVDATLVRHHPESYDRVLAGEQPAQRDGVNGTLAGLRFVRNRIGVDTDIAALVQPRGEHGGRVASWLWQPASAPRLDSLSARGREWEMARYQEYQAWLAGRTMTETFGRAASFLQLAADGATLGSDEEQLASGTALR